MARKYEKIHSGESRIEGAIYRVENQIHYGEDLSKSVMETVIVCDLNRMEEVILRNHFDASHFLKGGTLYG